MGDVNQGSAFVGVIGDYELGRKLEGDTEVVQVKVGLCVGVTLAVGHVSFNDIKTVCGLIWL